MLHSKQKIYNCEALQQCDVMLHKATEVLPQFQPFSIKYVVQTLRLYVKSLEEIHTCHVLNLLIEVWNDQSFLTDVVALSGKRVIDRFRDLKSCSDFMKVGQTR